MKEEAYFAGGCFWCTEAIFQRLKGVSSVTSGFMGGATEQPSYDDVVNGTTGHAETIRVAYDPAVIPYDRLVEVFFGTHDPTTKNRQGADVGTQYRSEIFTTNDEQARNAAKIKDQLEKDGVFSAPIVTNISKAGIFYPADATHQNYYQRDPEQPYCQFVINPKLAKLRQKFAPYLKDEGSGEA